MFFYTDCLMSDQKPIDITQQNFAADEAASSPQTKKEALDQKEDMAEAIRGEDQVLASELSQGVDEAAQREDLVDQATEDQDGFMLAALGYIPPLFLLPLLAKKDSSFCQFHGRQAMAMFIFLIAFQMLLWLFASSMALPFGFRMLVFLLKLSFIILFLVGMFSALGGKQTKIPPFATMAKSFKW